jgi:hypothetical protein
MQYRLPTLPSKPNRTLRLSCKTDTSKKAGATGEEPVKKREKVKGDGKKGGAATSKADFLARKATTAKHQHACTTEDYHRWLVIATGDGNSRVRKQPGAVNNREDKTDGAATSTVSALTTVEEVRSAGTGQ